MLRQHRPWWVIFCLGVLVGGALLPAGAAARPSASTMPPGIDIAIEQPVTASSEAAGRPATNAEMRQRTGAPPPEAPLRR